MSDVTRKQRARVVAKLPVTPRTLGSGTRPTTPNTASVDSLLLDYLNKPTVPGMQAVTLSVLQYDSVPHSVPAAPTCPPTMCPEVPRLRRSREARLPPTKMSARPAVGQCRWNPIRSS